MSLVTVKEEIRAMGASDGEFPRYPDGTVADFEPTWTVSDENERFSEREIVKRAKRLYPGCRLQKRTTYQTTWESM